MHSLFVRIFVLFWIAMSLIVGVSIVITSMVAAREYENPEQQRRSTVAIEASEVLDRGGLPELKSWLAAHRSSIADREVFIVGPDGRDILGRRLSDSAARRFEFARRDYAGDSERTATTPPRGLDPSTRMAPGNFRPPRVAPQIVSPDGLTYTVLLVPRRPGLFGVLSLPGISLTVLAIAVVVSAFASWWLAQHLSAPIRRIQAGARALAAERLDVRAGTRVSAGLEDRRDELAVLARDFDTMADQLRANRAGITQLLRDISHELRSPLARMRVALGLARQPGGDPQRQLERLEREIERLDGLISQVLKLARLHGTDAPFEREAVDLEEVLEGVVRDANFEGALKGCRVRLSGCAQVTVRGNRELLTSAIENVLRNAVRYSPPDSEVDLSIRARPGGDLLADAPTGMPPCGVPPGGLSIVVRDRGPGVPSGELQRIFEPFYRVAESRDRDSGGEGIGLAITAQVMKAHGGLARADNHSGGGLEVSLDLPCA